VRGPTLLFHQAPVPVPHPWPLAPACPSAGAAVPALRGKDYGKTRMKYPDYTETPSGLQYKARAAPHPNTTPKLRPPLP